MSRLATAALFLGLLAACSGSPEGTPDLLDGGPAADGMVADVPDGTGPADLPGDRIPEVPELLDLVDLVPELPPDLPDIAPELPPDLVDLVPELPTDLPAVPDLLEVTDEELAPLPCEEGAACDDGEGCTVGDTCVDGECVGEPYVCDDGRDCTLDSCDGLGNCEYTLKVGRCLINGICAKSGGKNPKNQCLFCDPAKDPFGWTSVAYAPCNDGDACTLDDVCVDGVCAGEEALCNDGNPCTKDLCDPATGCHYPAENVPCDDGDPCTALDFCEAGECNGGPAPPCDDGNPCTVDYCQTGKGCFYGLLDGEACDDDDACTIGDLCVEGSCQPGSETPVCDDWNDCTSDICDPHAGCIFPLAGNPCCINDINICDDGDPCTIDSCNVDTGACLYLPNEGSCTDKNACTENDLCKNGSCQGEEVDCDDGNPCTIDFCHTMTGCQHEPVNAPCDDGNLCTLNDQCVQGVCKGTKVNCNDYNPCTKDLCDPELGCQNLFNNQPCNDLDLCTTNDVCQEGECHGTPKSCNDSNPCTTDSCDPTSGCQNLFNAKPCDDGDPCTEGDHCSGGICVSGEAVCVSCDYAFSDAVNRLTQMKISTDAKPGNALDLNGDGKLDNSMAGIGGLANEPLQSAVDEGSVHLLLEHHGLKTDGNVYPLGVFVGDLAAGFETCDFAAAYCGYVVDEGALDTEACEPVVLFDNASIFQGKLLAGGKAYLFPWQIPLSEETVLDITLYAARIEATVTVQQGVVTKMSGVIGGAIPKQSFIAAVEAVPEDQLPLPKSMVLQLIQGLVVNDIDTDGNGSPDAASIAIRFEAIPGGIVGVE